MQGSRYFQSVLRTTGTEECLPQIDGGLGAIHRFTSGQLLPHQALEFRNSALMLTDADCGSGLLESYEWDDPGGA